MINLTNSVLVTKEGKELSSAVIKAIEGAKQCVVDHYLGKKIDWPSPDQITAGGKNPFSRLTIIKFFHRHDDPVVAPMYDAAWIEDLLSAARSVPTKETLLRLIPEQHKGSEWVRKHFVDQFKRDAILILHFLWFEKAVLLPPTLPRPVTKAGKSSAGNFEYAANYYPETLALVRYPFIDNLEREFINLADFLPSTSHSTFDWMAWRFIRSTDWHVIEDINVDDVTTYIEELTAEKRKSEGIPNYPFAPKSLLACLKEAFPSRCKFSMDDPKLINTKRQATDSAIRSGSFYVPKSLEKHKDAWVFYQEKFLNRLKRRGVQTWASRRKDLGILNAYLFEEIAAKAGPEMVPMPAEFSRKFIEDIEGIPNLIDYVKRGRQATTVRSNLLAINQFMEYLESSATTFADLTDFRNPISPDLDFPILSTPNSTSKAIFSSEHFPILLQFSYAIEAFGWFLAEQIFADEEQPVKKKKNYRFGDIFSRNKNVYDTEAAGFVPVVFTKNPDFIADKPRSKDNQKLVATPIFFVAKTILPLASRRLKNHAGLTSFPVLNYIQQMIIALETGIRNIHIRWLDRRTYDKKIDRSRPLPSICNLWVPTDKAHDEWGAKVSRSVIEVLDRQKESHELFDEPVIHEEAWYNDYQDGDFGKILSIFPSGAIPGEHRPKPGPLSETSCSQRFKKIMFSFDLFCRYSLGIHTTNKLPEEFKHIKSLDNVESYSQALKYSDEYESSLEHTPHSCRASVVTHWITILPPNVIGDYITGHSTIEHVLFYAKVDPDFLKRHQEFQKLAFENGFTWDESNISSIKAESVDSTLHRAFKENKEGAVYDFGAISFDKPDSHGDILSGVNELRKQPLDAVTFHGTHICPFADRCPKNVIADLKAIPGVRMPCGSCYYSVKTVDHLPRISGHIRSLVEEAAEIKEYMDDAIQGGADEKSLESKAQHRRFLADEISAWTVTLHCLEQMYQDIRTRDHFLVQQPEIVHEQLQSVAVEGAGLENLMARVAEAKTHSEFFTPRLKVQLKAARASILKRSGDWHRLLEDEPKGFTLLDEFRGIIRSTCETLGMNVQQLSDEIAKPALINSQGPNKALKLIFKSEANRDA